MPPESNYPAATQQGLKRKSDSSNWRGNFIDPSPISHRAVNPSDSAVTCGSGEPLDATPGELAIFFGISAWSEIS